MITNYNLGQFTTQNIYSALNILGTDGFGFYPKGQGTNPVPPVNTRIIQGLTMIAAGLTVLTGLTDNLIKGLVKDELNLISR